MAGGSVLKERRQLDVMAGLLLVLIAASCVLKALAAPVSRDEHQFIAAGALFAREGLLPYRDYPYFHAPYVSVIFGLAGGAGLGLLAAARLTSVVADVLTVCLLAALAVTGLRSFGRHDRLLAASTVGVSLWASGSFLFTAGLAGNHDWSVLLSLASLAGVVAASRDGRPSRLVVAGFFIGLASGVRLTSALLVVPLALACWRTTPGRLRSMGWFAGGAALGMAPLAPMLLFWPDAFVFGTLGYAELNTIYRQQHDPWMPLSLPDRVQEIVRSLSSGTTIVIVVMLVGVMLSVRARWRHAVLAPAWITASLLPFALAGALAPAPAWPQYAYAIVPLMLAVVAYALRGLEPRAGVWQGLRPVLVAVLGVSLIYGTLGHYERVENDRERWGTVRVGRVAGEIERLVAPGGRVLTLAPVYALEARRRIYPQLATGPFAWRTAYLLTEEERARRHVVGPADLDRLLADRPPHGILTGFEPELEVEMVAWATAHGYRLVTLTDGVIYLPAGR